MSDERDGRDDPTGRQATTPLGDGDAAGRDGGQPYGDQQYGAPSLDQQYAGQQYAGQQYVGQQYVGQQYGGQQYVDQQYAGQQYGRGQYGAHHYGSGQYGQQYGSGQYGAYQQYAPQYGQQYGAGWGSPYQQQYAGPYGAYGFDVVPAKPAPVVVAAVLAFLFGAVGVLVTLAALVGGAALGSLADEIGSGDVPAGALTVGFLIGGVVAAAWTVLEIWGGVWALTGRSRVLLIVGGSIATALTALAVIGALNDAVTGNSGAGPVVFVLAVFAAAVATVVLPCLSSSRQFYAAHRARRGR